MLFESIPGIVSLAQTSVERQNSVSLLRVEEHGEVELSSWVQLSQYHLELKCQYKMLKDTWQDDSFKFLLKLSVLKELKKETTELWTVLYHVFLKLLLNWKLVKRQQCFRELSAKFEELQPSKLWALVSNLTLVEGLVNIWLNIIYESGIRITLVAESSIRVLETYK